MALLPTDACLAAAEEHAAACTSVAAVRAAREFSGALKFAREFSGALKFGPESSGALEFS